MHSNFIRQLHDMPRTAVKGTASGARHWMTDQLAAAASSRPRHRASLVLCAFLFTVLALGPTLQAAASLAAVQKVRVVAPFCTDFNDGSTHGWSPCASGPQVAISNDSPGPSGAPSDSFLHAKDLSGASSICSGPEYLGNWTDLATRGCISLCFDLKIIRDGTDDPNDHLNLAPSVIFISDPDGPGGNPPLRARFLAGVTVSEDKGSNPGWHRVCAPLGLWLPGGPLPNDANGAWSMLDGKPDSDWNTLLTQVTEIQFPIDFTSNPAEEVGYDNVCIQRRERCACVETKVLSVTCRPDQPGSFLFDLSVENHSGGPVGAVLITPSAGSSFTFSQQLFPLTPPLADGLATTLTVGVTSASSGQEVCFTVTLVDPSFRLCGCSTRMCVTLPTCDCAQFVKETVEAVPGSLGTFTYTFTLVNASSTPISNIYLFALQPGTITPSYFAVSLPANGGSFTGTVTISGVTAGTNFCFGVGLYDVEMRNCCQIRKHCIMLPGPIDKR